MDSNEEFNELKLIGELENVFTDKKNNLIEMVSITGSKYERKSIKHFIKPILFYLSMLSSDKKNSDDISSCEFFKDCSFKMNILFDDKIIDFSMNKNISPEDAKKYLSKLIIDFLEYDNYDMLPFEIIAGDKKLFPPDKNLSAAVFNELLIEKIEDELNDDYSYFYYRDILKIIKPDIPKDALLKIKARYRYFFDLAKEKNI